MLILNEGPKHFVYKSDDGEILEDIETSQELEKKYAGLVKFFSSLGLVEKQGSIMGVKRIEFFRHDHFEALI